MKQPSTAAHCSITVNTTANLPSLPIRLEPSQWTNQTARSARPNVRITSTITAHAESFLLPGPDEVVRRVWHCERGSQYVVRLFDIWRAELAGHFAYRIYEVHTFRSITHSRHSRQVEALHLLVKIELVPLTASIPFLVKTGSQVDRANNVGA